MFKKLLAFILLAPLTVFAFSPENLYDITESSGVAISSIVETTADYQRTLEQVRDATVLVSMKSGFGSGIIINPQGLILTNYHIIHDVAEEDLKVWFFAEDELGYYKVAIVGIEPFADLALLQLLNVEDKFPILHLELEADVDNIKLAQDVWAVGHPLGMQWSVTRGILNSIDRPSFITAYVKLLQHTALIQRGNSGGPLVDKDGRVIGLNTYVTKPDDALGFGYATRSDDLYKVIQDILSNGRTIRPAMGIQSANLNEFAVKAVLKRYGEDTEVPRGIYGVIIHNVEEGDHASEQGLEELDVIITLEGSIINHNMDLHRLIESRSPGDIVELLIIRKRKFMYLHYELTELKFTKFLEYYDKRQSDLDGKPKEERKPQIPDPGQDDEPEDDIPYVEDSE
jgi:S1-C subfamily serine protease